MPFGKVRGVEGQDMARRAMRIKADAEAEVHDADGAPLPRVRPRPQRAPEVSAVPDLLPAERATSGICRE